MLYIIEKAEKLLDELPVPYPFTFLSTGDGVPYGMPGTVTGSLRAKDGRAVIVPLPESASSVVALPGTMRFITEAPAVMKSLVDALKRAEEVQSEAKSNKM